MPDYDKTPSAFSAREPVHRQQHMSILVTLMNLLVLIICPSVPFLNNSRIVAGVSYLPVDLTGLYDLIPTESIGFYFIIQNIDAFTIVMLSHDLV